MTMIDKRKIKAHSLRDYLLEGWKKSIAGKWHYRDLCANEQWRKGWISFDAVTYCPDDGLIYCGLNSIDSDILYAFDPTSGEFQCLHAQEWADAFDVKIHRTLLHNPHDGCFYFATSMLHDVDQQHEAAGGKLVRYDPRTGCVEILAVPIPMLYIQSIAADWTRGKLYGFTYPAEACFEFDLTTRQTHVIAWIGNSTFMSQPHNGVVDANGWLWGTYAETRAWDEMRSEQPCRLFRYHPEGRRAEWFDFGLSRQDSTNQLLADPPQPSGSMSMLAETRHPVDWGICDSMAFDGNQYIYAGTVAGVLCRIDTHTCAVEKVCNMIGSGRLPALEVANDGTVYGAGGMNHKTQVFRWRPTEDRVDVWNDLYDPQRDDGPARIHDIAVDNQNRLYLAENDNCCRSSYLWTVDV